MYTIYNLTKTKNGTNAEMYKIQSIAFRHINTLNFNFANEGDSLMIYRYPYCNNTHYFDNRNIYSIPHYFVTPQYYYHLQPYPNSTNLLYRDPCEYQQGTDTEWSATIYNDEPELRSIDERRMKLLLNETFTYGWSHRGAQSWGAKWGIRAVNEATEEIQDSIARMVNLKQLETFTKKDLKSSLDIAGAKDKDSASIKIGWAENKSPIEQMNWVNQNNLLVDIRDVEIVPGTDWSTPKNDWMGSHVWKASALMRYRLLIWGNA